MNVAFLWLGESWLFPCGIPLKLDSDLRFKLKLRLLMLRYFFISNLFIMIL